MAEATTRTRGRDSDTIRREIQDTRHQMDETIGELTNRLSADHVLDEIWGRVRSSGDGVGGVIREHPVPLALMGLGLGWLAVEQATGRNASMDGDGHAQPGVGTEARAEGRRGPYRGDAVSGSDSGGKADELKNRVSDAARTIRDRTKGAARSVSDAATEAGTRAASGTSRATDSVKGGARRVQDGARRVQDTAKRAGERAKAGFGETLRDNPLALGAIAVGLGLAVASSAPSTRAEEGWMERRSDSPPEASS